MNSQQVVRIWWGDTLLDQRVGAPPPCIDAGLRLERLTLERPERVKADPWSRLKDLVVPVAMVAMLLGALVIAVVPIHRELGDGFSGSLARSTDDGDEGWGSRQSTAPVQVAAAPRHGDARLERSREAILDLDAPTKDAPPIAPKDAAKKIVDQLFAGLGDLAKDEQLDAALGSLSLAGVAVADSGDGLGSALHQGGGGPLDGALGIGNIGRLGTRGRGGGESAYGEGVGLIAKRKSQIIVDLIGTPVVLGGLDKELIARVVRRHTSEIRYCYELALTRNPELSGREAVRWVIATNGAVAAAEVTQSLGDSELDTCVSSRIRTWQFPTTNNGGVVIVNYPWQFSPGS